MKKILLLFLCLCIYFLSSGKACAISLPGGLTIENDVAIGGRTSGNIVILNNDAEPVTVNIYQTDYMFYADGRSDFGKPGSTPRSNASWITYSPNQITVPPKGSASVAYQISVPNDQSLYGTYWSVIMVEPIPKAALEPPSAEKDKVAIGVQAVFRHAVQMITHIGDTGERALRFASKRLENRDGKVFLVLDVENTGERWLVPALYVDLADQSGRSLGRFEGGKLRIFPGCSVRYFVDLGALKPGGYNALVIADCGEEKLFGARYTLEVK